MGDLLAELDAAAQARRQQRQAERSAAPSTPELEAKRAAEAANWESLRANPEAWFDNRNNKQVCGATGRPGAEASERLGAHRVGVVSLPLEEIPICCACRKLVVLVV